MTRIVRFFALAAVLAASFALTPAAFADAPFLSANGHWVITAIVAPGETTCPGGPCDGTRPIHIRGQQFTMGGGFSGPAGYLFGNEWLITMNCNFDSTMAGPCWGSFQRGAAEPGENWVGVWSGVIDLAHSTGSYKSIGHGEGGRIEGMTFTLDAVLPGDQPYPYVLSTIRVVMPGRD